MVGAQYVHAGHVQAQDAGGAHRRGALLRGDADQAGGAAAMEVGAKLAGFGLALHGCHYLVADDEAADIGAAGLTDEFLGQDVGLEPHEGLDDALRRLLSLRQDHADALGTLQEFDDQGGSAQHFDQVLDVVRGVGETGHRQTDALAGQELQGAQLVAGAGDGDGFVEGIGVQHLELAQHGGAIEGHRGADAGDDGVIAAQFLALVVNAGAVRGDVHIAAQHVDDAGLVATLGSSLHQSSGRVEPWIAR